MINNSYMVEMSFISGQLVDIHTHGSQTYLYNFELNISFFIIIDTIGRHYHMQPINWIVGNRCSTTHDVKYQKL